VIVLVLACASKEVRLSSRMEGRYELPVPVGDWESVRPGGADHAWWSSDLTASFYVDSNCGVRFEDVALPRLVDSQLNGVSLGDPLAEEYFTLDGREAYTRLTLGRIDGVPVELAVTVMKKNQCTYDFVLVAPRGDKFAEAWTQVRSTIQEFQTE